MLKDFVQVADQGFARLRNRLGRVIAGRTWHEETSDKSVVEVKGWVKALCRERGKIVPGTLREGHNIWTNTGREYLALLMSIESGATAFRSDRMAWIGVGTGSTIEDVGVLQLVSPALCTVSNYLAPLDVPPTFPLSPTRTTVRYHRTFLENEITITPGTQVNISELGLFTNGAPTAVPPYSPGTRLPTVANYAPNAYKTFEPIGKTDALEFEVSWEIRF